MTPLPLVKEHRKTRRKYLMAAERWKNENESLRVYQFFRPFVQQILQLLDLTLQRSYTLFQRLGITPWESSTAQFIAGFALEANVGTLRTARGDAITANLLASASIASLRNSTLSTGANLDHLHGKDSRHIRGTFSGLVKTFV